MTFEKWLKAHRILKYGAAVLPPAQAYSASDMEACWHEATKQGQERSAQYLEWVAGQLEEAHIITAAKAYRRHANKIRSGEHLTVALKQKD